MGKVKRAGNSGKKPRGVGRRFEKGNSYRFKPGESGNRDGRPKCTRTPSEVLQEIELLAFSNMFDYIEIDGTGAFCGVNLAKLTRGQAAAIQEVKVDEAAGGAGDGKREKIRRTTFKLASKLDALEQLGRHHKLFTDKVELGAGDELVRRLIAGRKRFTDGDSGN